MSPKSLRTALTLTVVPCAAVVAASAATAAGATVATGCGLAHDALPAGIRCLTALRAQVTAHHGTDTVMLTATPNRTGGDRPDGFALRVVEPGGRTAVTRLPRSDGRPYLVRVGNVNRIAGAELVVMLDEISSGNTYGMYTFTGGALRRTGPLLDAGGDSEAQGGFACRTGRAPAIVARTMLGTGPIAGQWHWTQTVWTWKGATLRRTAIHHFNRRGMPRGVVTAAGHGCGRSVGA